MRKEEKEKVIREHKALWGKARTRRIPGGEPGQRATQKLWSPERQEQEDAKNERRSGCWGGRV